MQTIVMKFGGTSVADEHARGCAIQRIMSIQAQGYGVVAVVSAMGRKGAPYATDTLLGLIRPADLSSPRTRDLIMSCGETISACVFADSLEDAGIPAMPMNGVSAGIRTDGVYGAAEIIHVDAARINAAVESGVVPVITGFQGMSDTGDITTLGRGGSDTSAVVIGGLLGAEAVYIYTDVPGIAQADPRIVQQARFLGEVDSQDMLCLAENGAGVIHPRAVAAGERFHIPVRVCSVFDGTAGTLIRPLAEKRAGLVGIALRAGLPDDASVAVVSLVAHPLTAELVNRAIAALPAAQVSTAGDMMQAVIPQAQAQDAVRALYSLFE